MSASHIRADMFSEFIGKGQQPGAKGDLSVRKHAATPHLLQSEKPSTEAQEPSAQAGTPSESDDTDASEVSAARSSIQERPLMHVLQTLASHNGKMCIKSLLQSEDRSKLDTLRLLDQLEKLEFVEISASADMDLIELTTLGRWAAKYAD